jgi:hypothetical protein
MTQQLGGVIRSPHCVWLARFALTALLVGCSSDVGSPTTMADGPAGMTPGASGTGSVVTDANGNVVGTVDANGNVVDANGMVVGMVDPNTGEVIDPSTGGVVGSTTTTGDTTGGTATPGDTSTPGDTTATEGTTATTGDDMPSTGSTATPVDCSSTPVPVTTQIPRLTNSQYNRTIFDLVGATAPGLLAIEQAGDITNSIWGGYTLSAETIAADVMSDPAKMSNFITCTPVGDGADCLSQTITEFGLKAFRRPLTPEEVASFEALVAQRAEITDTGSFEEIAEVLLQAFLTSPSFLMRAEIAEQPDANGNFTLSSYEVASRLSYMLWGSMPDDELFAAAAADQLQSKEQILTQARRMVADPKARDIAAEMHREYLELYAGSRWDSAAKDSTSFPTFSQAAVPDMIEETEMLFDNIYASGGSFQDLLTTPKAYVTANTAPLYGLDAAMFGAEPTEVDLDPTMRPGFLTRVGFLAAYSPQTRTSPIIRGAFITKRVIGIDPGAPDPAAANTPLPDDPTLDTNRKRVEQQTSPPTCAGCHATIVNPSGFVMEVFDSAGVEQTTERDTGAPIDGVAEVRFDPDANTGVLINNPGELAANIAASASAQRLYAARWVGYAYGRELTDADACTADALGAKVNAGGYSIQDLLTDLTQTEYFQTRARN